MKSLFNSVWTLRRKNRVEAQLLIREEKIVKKVGFTILAPAFTAYAFVDWIANDFNSLLTFLAIRLLVITATIYLYWLLRDRVKHAIRFLLIPAIPTFVIQVIMIHIGAEYSPYFAGVGLVLFQAILFSPKTVGWTLFIFGLACSPSLYVFVSRLNENFNEGLVGLAMLSGTIVTCLTHTKEVRSYLIKLVKAQRQLAEELLSRNAEVERQARELVKRKQFERQFSPQVVEQVLNDRKKFEVLTEAKIATLICDVSESTVKIQKLRPEIYTEVIEEVFDVFSAGCLKHNLIIDKFTGDGAQAFAGVPEYRGDELLRAIRAAEDVIRMIEGRRAYIDAKWQGRLKLKFAVCEGNALVGFLGGGLMRSFTAIGSTVSLAHRLCAASNDNSIMVYSLLAPVDTNEALRLPRFERKQHALDNVRSFENQSIKAISLKPLTQNMNTTILGRCETCATPLVLEESATGIPRVHCPACSMATDGTQMSPVRSKL